MANYFENEYDNGRVNISEQGIIIDLCKNRDSNDHNESNREIENVITEDNIRDNEKLEAWRNLTYMPNKQSVRHKLPFMPPPERAKTMLGYVRHGKDEQKKTGIDIATQTDFPPIIKEASKTENESDLEQASQAGFLSGTEDRSDNEVQQVHSLIEKYSQENKAKLRDLFDSANRNKDGSLSKKKQKKYFFDIIHTSMWQIAICTNHLRHMHDDNSSDDHTKETEPLIEKSKEDDTNSAPIDETTEISVSQLSSDQPNVSECDIIEQQMQVIHGVGENTPSPQMSMTPPSVTSNDPRQRSRNKKQFLNDRQETKLIKRARFNTPETHEASAATSLNNVLQTKSFSMPPPPLGSAGWQGTRAGQQWRQQRFLRMVRPQWFNMKPPTMMPPPPPPPPPPTPRPSRPRFEHEPIYANQQPITMNQYQISAQQQEFAEYQKYQQMEMQKKAWESQLNNYPNSAWSYQLNKN